MMILYSFATGRPTAQMVRELGCDRKHLLEFRHWHPVLTTYRRALKISRRS